MLEETQGDALMSEEEPPVDKENVVEKSTLAPEETSLKKSSKVRRFFKVYWHKKRWTLPLTIIVLLGVLLAIPTTRYALVGWFWREDVTVTVYDSQNNSRITEATVKIDGQTVQTNKDGQATLAAVHVGSRQLNVEKKYYRSVSNSITVPVFANKKNYDVSLVATGRLTKVLLVNKITNGAVANVLVDAGDGNQARTDTQGIASIVIPSNKQELPVTLSSDGYNNSAFTLKQGVQNNATLTPVGKMYFLSNLSGRLDVVKTNYDGSDRETVVAGTGFEDDNDTTLLASRDWKYLALHAKRESGKSGASVYLINTTTGGISVVDQGDAYFNPIGWSDHNFIYSAIRNTIQVWQPKATALKSFNADTQKATILDETAASGNEFAASYESMAGYYILDGYVTYVKTWGINNESMRDNLLKDKQSAIMSVQPDGVNKKALKTYSAAQISYIDTRLYKPQEIYYAVALWGSQEVQYVELDNGAIATAPSGAESFGNNAYPTFLVSPDGQETFWAEPRDGKNALFVGGKNAENSQQLMLQSDYTPYGWMTDKYLLLQKGGSELYITTKEQIKNGAAPVKISDYHKPRVSFAGYGYGYGGQ